jgi:Ulp1 family protease
MRDGFGAVLNWLTKPFPQTHHLLVHDFIIIPVNVSGPHWPEISPETVFSGEGSHWEVAIVEPRRGRIHYFDSLSMPGLPECGKYVDAIIR